MITFLDENDAEYGALATIKATNAVNGERSLTGTIVSGDYVLSKIERGWRLRFDDEYYVVTYAKPVDEGKNVQVSFDAVHQFFWDFGKSSIYDQLSDGSHTFRAYLDFIFDKSGYRYDIESSLTVKAFEKQSFGYKNRLSLFNDIITSSGVEFQVNGKVVRILAKVGTDLSTVVRKNFNLNELGIEKNIGDFVTYQKGFGAYFDEEDHSKGRLVAEYTSPLASIYGKLEADPLVDERYKQSASLLSALKETVDNSYTISVSLDMEDLTRAGYKYKQPVAGDYIMAINETLGFKEKIRIVSFTSEYDVAGQLIKHTVTCNDIGSVKKLSASYTHTQHQAANAEVNANTAYEFANKALVSANGKNTNYYGDTFPVDNPKGTLKKGDLLFLTVGDTVKQYYWNGAEWVTNPVVSDVEAFKEQIAEDLKDVPNREEFENKIAEELANSKAEIETQIETAKTQAESNAKEYAETINQETAKVAEQANAAADEIKADLVNVKNNLTSTSLVANNAQAAVDAAKQELTKVNTKVDSAKAELTQAKQDLTEVASDLNAAKQDLTSHAQQLQTQANAQTELTKRVTTVETTANGTKTTVNELTKTVAQNGKDITSVTNRTKIVEDDLANTKTTLTQVQTTANSASQKTATLETGLNGLTAKFETLKIGSRNYFKNSKSRKYYINDVGTQDVRTFIDDEFWQNDTRFTKDYVRMSFDIAFNPALPSDFTTNVHFSASPWYNCGGITFKGGTTALQHFDLKFDLSGASKSYKTDNIFIRLHNTLPLNTAVSLENFNLYLSAVVEDYTQNEADIESKVAEYKQTADQNYASLQSNLQTLDGTVKQNKSEFDQTASQIKSSISSVEGKIPTNVSTRNLILKSNDFANPHKQSGDKTTVTSTNGYFVLKSTGYTANGYGGISWNMSISEMKAGEQFSILMPVYIDSSVSLDARLSFIIKNHSSNSAAYDYSIPTNKKDQWFNVAITFKAYKDVVFDSYPFYVCLVKNGLVRIKPPILVRGSLIPSDYQPAFEDAESDIAKLNTTLTQTADGLEQLSTQVTSQGGTITSHTNSINSLTTGLSAKVSQTDFNTLSGRVTTAENNIIAKANELSSKITSVEGKIPTNVSTRNLILKSNDFANPHKQNGANTTVTSTNDYFVVKSTGYTANAWGGMSWNMSISEVKAGEQFSILMPVYIDSSVNLDNGWGFSLKNHPSNSAAYYYDIPTNKKDQWFNVAITFKAFNNVVFDTYPFYVYLNKNGLVRIKPPMLVRGNLIPSDYQPAFEDAESDIAKLNTTLTQTADGLEQLSTQVTSQGGTITSHTNSINSLTTGLSAKVSQTDFNTLSGRVTTAENNITAKANELSSKITSVEGKIPTSSGGRNLAQGTSKDWSKPYTSFSGAQNTCPSLYKVLTDGLAVGDTFKTRIILKYTNIVPASGKTAKIWLQGAGNVTAWNSGTYPSGGGDRSRSISGSGEIVFELTDKINADHLKNAYWDLAFRTDWIASGSLQWKLAKAERGMFFTDWTPAPEDTISQISSLSSEFKQTTDAIKASVSSLDKSTVKSSSLTINSDGIVMKAGKSTTDVANAIGSYFSVNQNAINLFSDKINVKGNMIVNGAITSDKIASKSINTAHLNGKIITADVIATNAITANAIKAGAVTTDKMSANSINGDRIAAGTLDAAKIKAGSITASQIASGTITSSQIKSGTISAANIAAGAITSDKIAANSIDASKIAANAITANMITGGKLNSTNGATVFDLNAGTLTFNNNYGYIQRVASDKVFEITTYLGKSSGSQEYLDSAFMVRKSDSSRRAGVKFSLFNTVDNKPTAQAKINADSLILYDSQSTMLFTVDGKSTYLGTFNIQGWGDIPVANLYGGLIAKDVAIGGHTKSLLKIVEELCKKAGILWV